MTSSPQETPDEPVISGEAQRYITESLAFQALGRDPVTHLDEILRIQGLTLPKETIERIIKSTYQIFGEEKGHHGTGHGTGFALGDHLIVTNNHVVGRYHDTLRGRMNISPAYTPRDKEYIHIYGIGSRRPFTIREIIRSDTSDIALIETEEALPDHLAFAKIDPSPGTQSVAIGFGTQDSIAMSTYPVGDTHQYLNASMGKYIGIPFFVEETTPAWTSRKIRLPQREWEGIVYHGQSGWPRINEDGNVVGMNASGMELFHGMISTNESYAIERGELVNMLNRTFALTK